MTHDELQADLAETRRQCGEIVVEKLALGSWGHGGEADVATLKPSWTKPQPTIYEVKASRSDFRADVGKGKFERYLPHCRKLYFAAPAGMLTKDDIPAGMGLIVRGENGWHAVVAPRLQPRPEEPEVLMRGMLLRLGSTAPWRAYEDREQRIRMIAQAVEKQEELRYLSARVAPEVSEALNAAERRATEARAEVRQAEARLRRALALDHTDDSSLNELATRLIEVGGQGGVLGPDGVRAVLRALDAIESRVNTIRDEIREEP